MRRQGRGGAIAESRVAGLRCPRSAPVFPAVLVAGTACWVFGSDAQEDRVSRALLAW